MLHPNSTQINHSCVLLYSSYILQLQSTIITHIHIFRIINNIKMDVLSQVGKHVTYFLQRAISFWYSSATIQNKKIFRSVHSQHHRVPNNHTVTKWHPFKISKFIDKSSKIWKAVLTISNCHDICHFKAAMSNFTLAPPMHTLSRIPIGCHAPMTAFPACSLGPRIQQFIIHHNYLLFNIFAFINLPYFSPITITSYTN